MYPQYILCVHACMCVYGCKSEGRVAIAPLFCVTGMWSLSGGEEWEGVFSKAMKRIINGRKVEGQSSRGVKVTSRGWKVVWNVKILLFHWIDWPSVSVGCVGLASCGSPSQTPTDALSQVSCSPPSPPNPNPTHPIPQFL